MGAGISYPGMCWTAFSYWDCWVLHLGSLCWLLITTSVRSIFRVKNENCSVVQVSSQPSSAPVTSFCWWWHLVGPQGLFCRVWRSISWHHGTFCVVFGSDTGHLLAEQLLYCMGRSSPRSMEGVSQYRQCPWHHWSFSWLVLWKWHYHKWRFPGKLPTLVKVSDMGFASLPSTRHLLGRRELEQGTMHTGSKSALLLFNLERTWPKDVKRSSKPCLDTTSPHQLAALNSQQGGLIRKWNLSIMTAFWFLLKCSRRTGKASVFCFDMQAYVSFHAVN